VKRLPAQDDLGALDRINRAARVITGWVRDRRFSDESGQPADLPFDGGDVCFLKLVKLYSGDAPVRAVLDELMRVGVVERTPEGRIRLLERGVHSKDGEIDKIGILGSDTSDLISTIDNNICHPDAPFFQRKVSYDNLPSEALPELKKLAGEQSQALLELLDRWMSERDRDANPGSPGRAECGQGLGSTISKRTTKEKTKHEPHGKSRPTSDRSFIADVGFLYFFLLRGTGIDLAGGGVSGTGVSTGAITSFGSVETCGVHYLTDNNTIKMSHGMDHSSEMDRVVFRVGMVVTIHHGLNDNNAIQIEYQDNLQGPIAAKNSNTLTVLGQTVVVSDADFAKFNLNEIVEVSGFVDSAGRIRATYIERNTQSPITAARSRSKDSSLACLRPDSDSARCPTEPA